jgi:ribonuclease HI
MPYPHISGTKLLFPHRAESRENPPEHYLIAHSDGGARGNPGPAGYGVVIQDQSGRKVAQLISDSELLVRQIKGIYKVKNLTLKDLHDRAQQLISQLEWFSIGHALREHNQEADRLANQAMDKGTGRSTDRASEERVGRALLPTNPDGGKGQVATADSYVRSAQQELEGIIRNGVVELTNGKLPEGTRVQVRPRRGG